ncbi:hypothetical protein IWQ56_002473 [Coemansia nantahalensis]|nr:hypothetical protein IWQ56_002473 [Coemansia nantahalensis]
MFGPFNHSWASFSSDNESQVIEFTKLRKLHVVDTMVAIVEKLPNLANLTLCDLDLSGIEADMSIPDADRDAVVVPLKLQRMLGSLATQVAAAEHAAEESVSASAADQQQQQQQRSVGDALKDMANTEKAMDSFESRLDSLLSKLDSLIDDDCGSNSG